jgi:hypothetical protein
LKQYRGIATRYDKWACAFLGAIHWVAAVICLNWWQALNLPNLKKFICSNFYPRPFSSEKSSVPSRNRIQLLRQVSPKPDSK